MEIFKLKIRRDSEQRWNEINPILELAEMAYVFDKKKIKIGNGLDSFTDLPYFLPSNDELIQYLENKQNVLIPGDGIKIEGNTISATVDLSKYATQEWVEGKGYATTGEVQEQIQTVEGKIPTNNNQLTNGAGYQTAQEVNAIIDGKGFAKADQIPTDNASLTNGAGYQNAQNVEDIITGKGYITMPEVEGKGYQNAEEVSAKVNEVIAGMNLAVDMKIEEKYLSNINFLVEDSNKILIHTLPIKNKGTIEENAKNIVHICITGDNTREVTIGKFTLWTEPKTLYVFYIPKDGLGWNEAPLHIKIDVPSNSRVNEVEAKIPTDNKDLTNGAGYVTDADVTAKGYTTMGEVESKIAENTNGYQTAENVESAITGKGYQTADQVNATVDGKGFAKENNLKTINGETIIGTGNIEIQGGGGGGTVDSALSTTSENPVQNKVITNKINEIETKVPPYREDWEFTTMAGDKIIKSVYIYLPKPNQLYVENCSGAPNEVKLVGKYSSEAPNYKQMEYSLDGYGWELWNDPANTAITLPDGGRLYLRDTNNERIEYKINTTGNFNIGGDLTSLFTPDGGLVKLTQNFDSYFKDETKLINAKDLIIPTTELGVGWAYDSFFENCTNLESGPVIPNITQFNSYGGFYHFYYGCSKINYIEVKFTNWGYNGTNPPFKDWVKGVSPTGTFAYHYEYLPLQTGTDRIPSGWEKIKK